jgi:hypothetical protein
LKPWAIVFHARWHWNSGKAPAAGVPAFWTAAVSCRFLTLKTAKSPIYWLFSKSTRLFLQEKWFAQQEK